MAVEFRKMSESKSCRVVDARQRHASSGTVVCNSYAIACFEIGRGELSLSVAYLNAPFRSPD